MVQWKVCDYSIAPWPGGVKLFQVTFHSDAGDGGGTCWSLGNVGTDISSELGALTAIAQEINGTVLYNGKIYDGSGLVTSTTAAAPKPSKAPLIIAGVLALTMLGIAVTKGK